MTFAVLRALYGIIGEALDDIERVYQSQGQDSTDGVAVDGDKERELSARDWSPQSSPPSTTKSSKNFSNKRSSVIRHRSSLSAGSFNASCSKAYASPPPSPCVTNIEQRFESKIPKMTTPAASTINASTKSGCAAPPTSKVDFPSLDAIFNATSPSETLTSHPKVVAAINRIIGACGQMTATVQTPFLTICDSVMSYHLPSCMRLVEAAHVVEIIKEHGSPGLHVDRISQLCGVDASKLAHILRLLATHHIFQEVSPDVFALNRISSIIDSGKSVEQLAEYRNAGRPELKYQGTNGIAAFVGLCADEIGKASAYMTEAYLLSSSPRTREANQPTLAPFVFAFGAIDNKVDYFGWLEGEDDKQYTRTELGHGSDYSSAVGLPDPQSPRTCAPAAQKDDSSTHPAATSDINRFRLERFGKAMSGTGSWESPGAVFSGFDWQSLPPGSVVVDVGGGIGSTSMLLATAFSAPRGTNQGLKFVIQDREPVTIMGEKAWREKYPELLENSTASFQVHDFFTPQPVKDAAVFLLRVVLHDWPDDYARKILVHLREAATSKTKLLLGEFVLPLACADDITSEGGLEGVEGAQRELAPAPLLPNLGKGSANGYWMDLTMNVMFNSQERTLREIVALALSAGWKVTKVTQAPGHLFGYIVAVPTGADPAPQAGPDSTEQKRPMDTVRQHKRANAVSSTRTSGWDDAVNSGLHEEEFPRRPSSRCGTPIPGSRAEPQSQAVANALAKFGGGVKRYRGPGAIGRGLDDRRCSSNASPPSLPNSASLSPSTSTSSSPSSAPPLKPSANLVLTKQRSAFDIRSSYNSEGYGQSSPSNITSSRSMQILSQTGPALHAGDPRRPSSPSPINMQIANAPRKPPPPAPPRSLRRPSSLANLRPRTISLNQLDAPTIPAMPSFSPLHSNFCAESPTSSAQSVQLEKVVHQRAASPAHAYGRALRGRSSYSGLSSSGAAHTNSGGICTYRDHILSTSPPAYSPNPSSLSNLIPSRLPTANGSSIPRASPAFTTSSPTRGMHVSVSQQIGMGPNGASVCVNVAPHRKPVLKEVGRRASSAQLSSNYYTSNRPTTMATTQVRFSENVPNGGIGRSPAPQTTNSKRSSAAQRGEKERSVGSGVANYLRGAGQKLGGILKFERQDGHEKMAKRMDAYMTDSARIRGHGGQINGSSVTFS